MEPSFALLPSAHAGQIAFAEVSMAVKYFVQRGGFELVVHLLDRLKINPNWKNVWNLQSKSFYI